MNLEMQLVYSYLAHFGVIWNSFANTQLNLNQDVCLLVLTIINGSLSNKDLMKHKDLMKRIPLKIPFIIVSTILTQSFALIHACCDAKRMANTF